MVCDCFELMNVVCWNLQPLYLEGILNIVIGLPPLRQTGTLTGTIGQFKGHVECRFVKFKVDDLSSISIFAIGIEQQSCVLVKELGYLSYGLEEWLPEMCWYVVIQQR